MHGFKRAMQEYENRLFDPYGNEDWEEEYQKKQDYLETQADYMLEEMRLGD